jgi:hypothetical protein
MNELIKFEIESLPPSVNKMYKRSKTGGVFCDPSVIEFEDKVKLLLNELKFCYNYKTC